MESLRSRVAGLEAENSELRRTVLENRREVEANALKVEDSLREFIGQREKDLFVLEKQVRAKDDQT